MPSTIAIKTRLHSGIYKSSGGGETRTHYTWATGPRNLLTAIAKLGEHRKAMCEGYGSIGCGITWLEIDGVEVEDHDLREAATDDRDLLKGCEFLKVESRTEKARQLIARVQSGTYAEDCAAVRAAIDADLARMDREARPL